MAIATTGPLIGQIQGRIGGIQINRRSGGITVAKSRRGSSNASPDQLAARARLTTVHQRWLALGEAHKNKWRLWAQMHPAQTRLGTVRTRTPLQALAWWIPFGEAGQDEGFTPDYVGPNHSLISPSPAPMNLVFSAAGTKIIQCNFPIYPAYHQYLFVWIGLGNAYLHPQPRRWFNLGAIYTTTNDVHIETQLAAKPISLIPGQYVYVRTIHLIKGVPNYWPSENAYASTLVYP
jgi:hypothetical protein